MSDSFSIGASSSRARSSNEINPQNNKKRPAENSARGTDEIIQKRLRESKIFLYAKNNFKATDEQSIRLVEGYDFLIAHGCEHSSALIRSTSMILLGKSREYTEALEAALLEEKFPDQLAKAFASCYEHLVLNEAKSTNYAWMYAFLTLHRGVEASKAGEVSQLYSSTLERGSCSDFAFTCVKAKLLLNFSNEEATLFSNSYYEKLQEGKSNHHALSYSLLKVSNKGLVPESYFQAFGNAFEEVESSYLQLPFEYKCNYSRARSAMGLDVFSAHFYASGVGKLISQGLSSNDANIILELQVRYKLTDLEANRCLQMYHRERSSGRSVWYAKTYIRYRGVLKVTEAIARKASSKFESLFITEKRSSFYANAYSLAKYLFALEDEAAVKVFAEDVDAKCNSGWGDNVAISYSYVRNILGKSEEYANIFIHASFKEGKSNEEAYEIAERLSPTETEQDHDSGLDFPNLQRTASLQAAVDYYLGTEEVADLLLEEENSQENSRKATQGQDHDSGLDFPNLQRTASLQAAVDYYLGTEEVADLLLEEEN